ncbi:threonine-phosphate decarboxylase CobD [Pseudomonas oryzihabitans]|uniref:threonine-phosphate decarboxylase CobD n=1 Tax=Pseudomonas oryzihabitans TaxID=47885 RepID=UPI0028961D1F|nr:threonine-phosphate decarboxylase CobD [Pseudomonas oryzihabitans]MDT3720289.1 threonine-phosphate decarboxylase CobD [Pseudomonas oryzihabitans]
MLEHGGRLRRAARTYDIPLDDWLDLSTGLAPWPWPLPEIPASAWARLPEPDDGLVEAACAHYRAPAVLPVAGSQAAIQALPTLRAPSRVAVLAPCYAEHALAWRRAGHEVRELDEEQIVAGLDSLDVLVVVNPNNPTGLQLPPARLLDWHGRLERRGGWLVVDEAFMDATPGLSLAPYSDLPGLIVLRSFGKFFGLAGLRLGFVLAAPDLLARLDEHLGPWTVNGPSRHLARQVLADVAAHERQRQVLLQAGDRLATLLTAHHLPPSGGCALFQLLRRPDAAALHEHLARQAVFTRLFPDLGALRFGLPADESGWQRLEQGLARYRSSL